MAAATATRTRARKSPAGGIAATPAEMHALIGDIKLQERNVERMVILRGALAAKNIYIEGPAGTGKSMLAREFCKRIGVDGEDMRHFEKTLHPQMPADALLGPYDIETLLKESRLERKIEGYLPNAHSAFLDELVRSNGPVTDALLPLMNPAERLFEHNGRMSRSPMLFLVTAGNWFPDHTDPRLHAFASRITLICSVEYIKSDESFKQLLREDQSRLRGEPSMDAQVRVGLEAFKLAQHEVNLVDGCRSEFMDEVAALRRAAKDAGLNVDDRRWIDLMAVARAQAWLSGRDYCSPEDLVSLEHGLYRVKAEIPEVLKLLRHYRSSFDQLAEKLRDEVEGPMEEHKKLRPVVEGSTILDQDTSSRLTNAGREMRVSYGRVKAGIVDAERQQRDAAALRDLFSELEDWREWRDANDLPAKWD